VDGSVLGHVAEERAAASRHPSLLLPDQLHRGLSGSASGVCHETSMSEPPQLGQPLSAARCAARTVIRFPHSRHLHGNALFSVIVLSS
jgi:hypothetical protein